MAEIMSSPVILIIDDEESMRFILEKALKNESYEIYTAKNGREGLELFNKYRPKVVILDLFMPIMDGFDFLWEVQPKPDDEFEVIAVTVHANDEEIIRCYDMGVSRLLRKPVLLPEIRRIVKQSLDNKAREIEHRTLEIKIEKNESLFRKIIEDQSELICRFHTDGILTFANRAYSAFENRTRDELLNKVLFSAKPEEERTRLLENLISLAQNVSGTVYEHQLKMPDGSSLTLQWTASADPENSQEIQAVGRIIRR